MIRARIKDRYPRARIVEPITSCKLTDRVSDEDLFFSVFTSVGEQKLTVIDSKNNEVYLTGKR